MADTGRTEGVRPGVEEATLVQSDFEAMVELFGSFATSRFSDEGEGLMLCDGGSEAALENYALLLPGRVPDSEGAVRALVRKGLDFFAERNRSHIWPVFPGLPEWVAPALDDAGVRVAENFYGMVADVTAMDSVALPEDPLTGVVTFKGQGESGARAWADATWYGFDSGEPAPESFLRFTEQAMASDDLVLIGLSTHLAPGGAEEIGSTGMLCTARDLAGIYYIATHPKFRRRGLALRVMKELLELAKGRGHSKICLLATPEGRPLYHRCGFRDTCVVPVRVVGEY